MSGGALWQSIARLRELVAKLHVRATYDADRADMAAAIDELIRLRENPPPPVPLPALELDDLKYIRRIMEEHFAGVLHPPHPYAAQRKRVWAGLTALMTPLVFAKPVKKEGP